MGAMLEFKPKSTGMHYVIHSAIELMPCAFAGRTSVLARVGVSFISIEQACANAEEEIPDFDFERVRAASRAQWSELLGRIQVDTRGVDPEIVDLLYSSVYRTHLSPADCAFYSVIPWSATHMNVVDRLGREPALELPRAVLRLVLLQRECSLVPICRKC